MPNRKIQSWMTRDSNYAGAIDLQSTMQKKINQEMASHHTRHANSSAASPKFALCRSSLMENASDKFASNQRGWSCILDDLNAAVEIHRVCIALYGGILAGHFTPIIVVLEPHSHAWLAQVAFTFLLRPREFFWLALAACCLLTLGGPQFKRPRSISLS